ncbi:MAG: biopolymer transporter ExbD [Gemmatimonadales bacterium]|nr:biopolymer transporter ExbD [Gemmatimonadales bacterium]NIN10971.1 biopolymer transporter ExbD [Gemmatimonadales bacterium]NIN49563.1 biopolymer transporter ExbD [Gemmatimonadales bacterium]NIP07027.1 biopolymer transporter ExbD [Gemmatimonadales bacterium]NIR01661.1 biopolymer transporter ExbD [Gemmatimonadales bacterium]
MAINLPGSAGGPQKDPNVVPMIDILLVLLIIFMMQIPLSRKAMDVQVPPEQRRQQSSGPSQNIVLELKADGTYEINGQPVPKPGLDRRFHEIYDNRPQKILFVKSSGNRRYQEVIEAMDIARGAGVQVIGFTPPN